VLVAVAALPAIAYALPGDLDTSFGNEAGFSFVPIDQGGGAHAVALAPDGKIVTAGTSETAVQTRLAVMQFTADGLPDPSFNGGAVKTLQVGANTEQYGRSVAVQPDGKIVAAGTTFNGTNWTFMVVRLLPDGTPDGSFSGDGIMTFNFQFGYDGSGYGVALQGDGKIIVVGSSSTVSASSSNRFAIARITTGGILDVSFNPLGAPAGTLATDIAPGAPDIASAVTIDGAGRAVVAGRAGAAGSEDVAVARYATGGSLDASFSADGVSTYALSTGDDGANSVNVLASGSIVTAGYIDHKFAVDRITSDGTLDASFGTGGFSLAPLGPLSSEGQSSAVQSDGKVVVSGQANVGGSRIVVARYATDGKLDPTYGDGGTRVTKYTDALSQEGQGVVVQPSGKIVVASETGGGKNFTLVRFFGGDPPGPPAAPVALKASFNKSLKSKLKAKKLKTIGGTAVGTGLVKVQIAVNLTNKKLLKKKRCLFLSNARGRLSKYKTKRGKCAPVRWLDATGTATWKYKLKKNLKPGSYKFYVRAIGQAGAVDSPFTKKLGNLKTVKLTK
jgi:uncharacterized delta-60 repeat protein